jgi:hypothetical protein
MATIRGKLGHLECLCRACLRDGIDFQLTKLRSSHRSALSGALAKRVASEQLHRINDLRRCGPFCRESLPYPYSSLTKAKLPLSRSTGRSTLRSCPPDFSIRRCR